MKQAASAKQRMTLMAGTPVTNISAHALLSTCCLLHSDFLLGLLLDLENGGEVPAKCRLAYTGLQIVCLKLFKCTLL
jgi:hypothetical protein